MRPVHQAITLKSTYVLHAVPHALLAWIRAHSVVHLALEDYICLAHLALQTVVDSRLWVIHAKVVLLLALLANQIIIHIAQVVLSACIYSKVAVLHRALQPIIQTLLVQPA